jgi:hypothetical protein
MVCDMPLRGTGGRVWALLGRRKNSKQEKCSKMAPAKRTTVHELVALSLQET